VALEKGEDDWVLMKRRQFLVSSIILLSNIFGCGIFPVLGRNTKETLARALDPNNKNGLYELPEWFDSVRVQAHTRLSPKFFKKTIFFEAAKGFKEMGVKVFIRHIKTADEGAWWPSKIGAVLPEVKKRNIAKEIIDNAHALNLRIIVYHRHMEDKFIAEKHPDWVCVNWNGDRLRGPRGNYLCFNSPYAEFFLDRASELARMGADGFYFDHVHMPPTGCWCSFCKDKFKEEMGIPYPKKFDLSDSIWHRLIDFNNRTVERTFSRWRTALHDINPELVLIVSSYSWPSLTDRHLSNRLLRISDSVKSEFRKPVWKSKYTVFDWSGKHVKGRKPDVMMGLGYSLMRDAADGRPAHIWMVGLRDERSILYATAGVLTHGCIANLDVNERTIPNPIFRAAFKLGEKVSPYFAGTKPFRWALIHYSEYARDRYANLPEMAVTKIIAPFYFTYFAFLRMHLPVGFVTDSQLEEGIGNNHKILLTSSAKVLNPAMRSAVEVFRKRGGIVVDQQKLWAGHDLVRSMPNVKKAVRTQLRDVIRTAPVQVFGGPTKMHAEYFIKSNPNRVIVSLANDFSWVKIGKQAKKNIHFKRISPCTNVSVRLKLPGRPKRAVEIISQEQLPFQEKPTGLFLDVPAFDYMSVVEIDLNEPL